MIHNTRTFIALMATVITLSSLPAWAEHEHEDIVVGHTGANQLAVEFDHFGGVIALDPVSGLLSGWAGDHPGFAHLETDEPDGDFYTLANGADIYLEIISIDTALRGNPLTDDLDASGEQAFLGDHELHDHIDWLIDSNHAGFNTIQTQWDVSFKLVDMGTTNYADSAAYTLSYTNIPEPGSVVLLTISSLWAIRRSRARGRLLAVAVATCIVGAFAATPSFAQHTGDVWIGVNTNGQLASSSNGFVPAENYAYLIPASGLLQGWSDDNPGFDRLATAEEGLVPMQSGASIWLEVVQVDPAFRVIDDAFQILDEPGDDTELGDHTLHQHIAWHINSNDPAYDPEQCVWHAEFVLRDDGSTAYTTSDPLVFNFTNVPVRPYGTPANGDFDEDIDVDWDDYAAFAACLFGPATLPQPDEPAITTCEVECLNAFDFDDDRDVDLSDYGAFQAVFGN